MHLYEKAITPGKGLRLHLNENTGGPSPAVLEALRRLTPDAIAYYPDYSEAIAAVADRLGVPENQVLLTNGLDEGILAASLAAVQTRAIRDPEAIVVVPAFDMQAACAAAVGARVVPVPLLENFEYPTRDVVQAVMPATRIIFITNPNNPTGIVVPREAILAIAAAAPEAILFVDEAYADFSGSTLVGDPALSAHPNIVVGRTFAKAYGLAALRCGALVGAPAVLAGISRVLPPYSVNVAAAVALPAALRDVAYYEWYLREVRESKALLYAALDRLAIPYWRSEANFVLVNVGADARRVCRALASAGIFVRDRSNTHGCGGCVRITAGLVTHTARCIEALEEVLCGAR